MAEAGWRVKTLRIAWGSDQVRRVPCLSRLNGLAITKTPNGYSITHVKSGVALTLVKTKRAAIAALNALAPLAPWTRSPADLRDWMVWEGTADFLALLCDDMAGGDRTVGLGMVSDGFCAEAA